MTTTIKSLPLLRILQLASSNLPVGSYSFSHGLEYAIDAQWLRTVADVQHWIDGVVGGALTYTDVPLIKRQFESIEQKDWQTVGMWNAQLLAMRETKEILAADMAMGQALLRLANGMNIALPEVVSFINAQASQSCASSHLQPQISYITVFSALAKHFAIDLLDACIAHAWTLLENQVMAGTKLLPMGQTAAQTMLAELVEPLMAYIHKGLAVDDDSIGLSLPGLAIASALHETQYTRLYAS